MTLAEKIAKFEEMVAWFGSDDMDIEQAFGRYDEASALATEIRTELEEMQNKITVLAGQAE